MKAVINIGTTKVEYDSTDKRTIGNIRRVLHMVEQEMGKDGEIRPKNYREDH